jgi:hypothetical protein
VQDQESVVRRMPLRRAIVALALAAATAVGLGWVITSNASAADGGGSDRQTQQQERGDHDCPERDGSNAETSV